MSLVLLDSNLIIYSVDPADAVARRFIAAHRCIASEVSIVETLGFHRIREADRVELERFFARCPTLPVTRAVIDAATRLRQQRKMSLGDALIAGTAAAHGLTLATRNAIDFAGVEGLLLVDPYVG